MTCPVIAGGEVHPGGPIPAAAHWTIPLPLRFAQPAAMRNHFLYPALDRCYRLGRYLLQEILTEVGVYAGQDRVLCGIHTDRPNIQSELGRRLHMDEKCLHRSLTYLQKLHYVEFQQSRSDMRINVISLTDWGKRVVEIIDHTYGIVGKQMCVGMSPLERAEFERLLGVAVMREEVLRARKLDLREVLDRGFF